MLRHCRISLCKLLRNDHPRSLSIRSLSIRPLWIRSLCIRSLSIQTLRLRALYIRTLRIRPLCIRTLCIRSLRPHHKLTATVRTKFGAPWNLCPAFAAILHIICHGNPPFSDQRIIRSPFFLSGFFAKLMRLLYHSKMTRASPVSFSYWHNKTRIFFQKPGIPGPFLISYYVFVILTYLPF